MIFLFLSLPVNELCGPSWRNIVSQWFEVMWALCYMALAGIGYALRDWFHIQLVIAASALPFFVFYWWVNDVMTSITLSAILLIVNSTLAPLQHHVYHVSSVTNWKPYFFSSNWLLTKVWASEFYLKSFTDKLFFKLLSPIPISERFFVTVMYWKYNIHG